MFSKGVRLLSWLQTKWSRSINTELLHLCRCLCLPSWGERDCGGLWGCDCWPLARRSDPEQGQTERLLFGLLSSIWSWRPLWQRSRVWLLRELQPRNAMHQWWGRGWMYKSLLWFQMPALADYLVDWWTLSVGLHWILLSSKCAFKWGVFKKKLTN